jgi:hypothetical protein
VKQLRDELGFIENVAPGDEAKSLGQTFVQLLRKHGGSLQTRYGVAHAPDWPADPHTQELAPQGTDPKFAYIFYEKIWDELKDALEQTGLALPGGRGGDLRWVGVHPKMADIYMTALAEEIARNRGYYPVTDETLDHLTVTGCTVERLAQALLDDVNIIGPARTTEERERQMVRIALQSVVPENIESVPTQNIVKVRKQHIDEFVGFQEYIHKLVKDLAEPEGIQDNEQFERHLAMAFSKNIEPKLDELREALGQAGIRSALGAMNISTALPSIVGLATEVIGLPVPASPIVTVAGIAFGLTKVLLDHRKATTDAMSKSPVAWLMRLERDLPPDNLLSWIVHDIREFFSGI